MDDESPPLPDLHQGELSGEDLARLFHDLEHHAEIVSVRGKPSALEHSTPPPLSLAEGLHALSNRTTTGLQIRYRWGGANWVDTILVTPVGWRVVRMQTP